MTDKIVMVDFAGTLIKAEMIEEANTFRAKVLEKSLPTKEQHANPEQFYEVNRDFVEKLTGLSSTFNLNYRKNDLSFMQLTGKQVHNQISTNLFQIGMYMVANKYKTDIYPENLISQLQRIQGSGYKLAIVSGVRTDIISGMLAITNPGLKFDYIYGQPPILGVESQDLDVKELQSKGIIAYSLGDKLSDLERGKESGLKSIYVKWGHPSGGEEDFADYTIEKAEELEKIIQ